MSDKAAYYYCRHCRCTMWRELPRLVPKLKSYCAHIGKQIWIYKRKTRYLG